MPKTYKLTVAASVGFYKPIIVIEETNGSGVVKGATGENILMFDNFDMKFRPDSLSMDFFTISGKSISLVYANIDTYSIFGTTSALTTMHEIWDQVASIAAASF
ncbi:MAG: hypothetical protein [Bacteriophage sp.]|nr:MAG: hypothetical protein [Bacteriophage sp.]